jgi:hypothetical protein
MQWLKGSQFDFLPTQQGMHVPQITAEWIIEISDWNPIHNKAVNRLQFTH